MRSLVAFALALAALSSSPALACIDTVLAGRELMDRPHARGNPTVVQVGYDVIDVREIDGQSQTFAMDLYFWLQWNDERMAFDPAVIGDDTCRIDPHQIKEGGHFWTPHPEFINLREESRRGNELFTVSEDGDVYFERRFTGTFDASFELTRFPLDSQELPVFLESFYPRSEVVFEPVEENRGEALDNTIDTIDLPAWGVLGVHSEETTFTWESDADSDFSRYVYSIQVERRFGYYLWKIVVPLLLIVMLSWLVFWMSAESLEAQMGVSVTCILSVIAFNFVIADSLPKIPYLTLLDLWVLISYLFVFMSAVENVGCHYLTNSERQPIADRIDRVCRWAFPLGFLLVNVLVVALRV